MTDAAGTAIADITAMAPEFVLIGGACILMLVGGLTTASRRWFAAAGALVIWAVAMVTLLNRLDGPSATGAFFANVPVAFLFRLVGFLAALAVIGLEWSSRAGPYQWERYACILVITAGVNLVAVANDLVGLFLALELISIPTYVLLYLFDRDSSTREAVMKYFFLSIFASGLFLYGSSFLYGVAGSTNLEQIEAALASGSGGAIALVGIAVVLVVAGISFRITAVPFHFYAPDVYQGAPTAVVAILAYLPKLAGFYVLARVVLASAVLPASAGGSAELAAQSSNLFWILTIVSMTVGNVLGLLQNNIKRLLAYSGVAHGGYMLLGIGAGHFSGVMVEGVQAVYFYLVVYGLMTVGAFAGVIALNQGESRAENVEDLAGLSRTHPLIAFALAVCLFSLTGLPPTAGFWAKLFLFLSAWSTQSTLYRILALAMAINAAIAAWYYLRMIAYMYLRPPAKPIAPSRAWPAIGVLIGSAAMLLLFFALPGGLWRVVETGPAKGAVETALVELVESVTGG